MTFPRRTPTIPPDVHVNRNPPTNILGVLMSFAAGASGLEIIGVGCAVALGVLVAAILLFLFVSSIDRSKKHG
jgi:hypothetical protein